jgi:hypothetical protein
LKETELLKKAAWIFMLPNAVLGIAAIINKYPYILVPIYETPQCTCYHSITKEECFIVDTNVSLFFIVNWFQTITLVYLLWAIRNVKDELNLKNELSIVIFIWVLFSLSYFIALQYGLATDNNSNEI